MGSLYSRLKKETTANKLKFGVHENVVIRDIFIGKKKKENSANYYPQEIFLTFTKLNEKNEVIAEKEFSFWKFDPFFSNTKTSNIEQKIKSQLDTYYQILFCYYPFETVEKIFDPTGIVGITDQTSDEEIMKILRSKENLDKINEYIKQAFKKAITPLMGLDSKYRFRLKVTYDKKGYLNLGYGDFIESMKIPKEASKLYEFSITELKYKNNAEASIKADSAPRIGQPGMPLPPIPGIPDGIPGMPDQNGEKINQEDPGFGMPDTTPNIPDMASETSKVPTPDQPENLFGQSSVDSTMNTMPDPDLMPGMPDAPNF